MDAQAQSLHFFNAVCDRVDTCDLPDSPALPDLSSVSVADVPPSKDDHAAIFNNFAILAHHIVRKYMPLFKYASDLDRHIQHQHYREMSQCSEVVSVVITMCSLSYIT